MSPRLQAELKQRTPFPRATAEAFLAILRTAAMLDHHLSEALRPSGITPTQYNVLRILRGAGPAGLCGREIADRLVSKVPDVSRLLDRMAEMALVSRERSAEDRRHVLVRITESGRATLEKATPALEEIERTRFRGVDRAQVERLIATLDAVRTNR
jgi:DNA-binding MarR family transcriptional regulator